MDKSWVKFCGKSKVSIYRFDSWMLPRKLQFRNETAGWSLWNHLVSELSSPKDSGMWGLPLEWERLLDLKKRTLCLQLFLLIFFTEYLGPVSWHLAPLHKPHHHFHSQPKDHHCQWQQYMWHHHWIFQHCLADPFLVSSHMLQAEQVWDQPCCWGQPKTITTLTSFVIKNLYKRDIKNKFWEQCYLNNITRCCPKIKAISNWIFLNNTKFSFEFTKTYIVAWQLFVCKSPALEQVLSSTHKHSLIYESHNQPSTTFACP